MARGSALFFIGIDTKPTNLLLKPSIASMCVILQTSRASHSGQYESCAQSVPQSMDKD